MRPWVLFLLLAYGTAGKLSAQLDSGITLCQSEISLSSKKKDAYFTILPMEGKHSSFIQIEAIDVENPEKDVILLKLFIDHGDSHIEVGSFSFYPVDRPDKFVFDLKENAKKKNLVLRLSLYSPIEPTHKVHITFKKVEWIKKI
jgi:hypothetical protein